MRIGIDARPVDDIYKIGIGSYAYNLINALAGIDSHNEYFLFYNSLRRSENSFFRPSQKNFHNRVIRFPQCKSNNSVFPILLWRLSENVRKENIKIFHSTVYKVIKSHPVKLIATIHDLTPFNVRLEYFEVRKKNITADYSRIIKFADKIIVVSENTKKDLISFFNISEDRVAVTHLGVSSIFQKCADADRLEKVRKYYALPNRFILYVGNIGAHKNIKGLIEAFNILKSKGSDHRLVCVGSKGSVTKEIMQLIEKFGLKERVIFTGYVKDEDLPYIYNLASVFAFPSLYEGFGLPILEAMACGVPVVASNVASIPEVAGDAALLFDPRDPQDIAAKIDKIIRDAELRGSLIGKGLGRVKKFTWENTARKTLEVYNSVC